MMMAIASQSDSMSAGKNNVARAKPCLAFIERSSDAQGSADAAEATPTPRQRAVIERYLKRRESRPDAQLLSIKSQPNQPLAISQPSLADIAGFALAFGTTEAEVANILLNSLISAPRSFGSFYIVVGNGNGCHNFLDIWFHAKIPKRRRKRQGGHSYNQM
ncbi:MAG: hypothetical protein ACLPOA_20925 [Methylocella sp.]